MLRLHPLIAGLVALALGLAPAWAAQETPASASSAGAAPAAAGFVGPPRPPPPGMDPYETAIRGEDPLRAALWRAWTTAEPLAGRVQRLQRAGLAAGVHNLDAPARALLLAPSLGGDAHERARYAVELAPGLPAAHAALAQARYERWELLGAWAAMRKAAEVAMDHLEGRLWLEATAHDALFGACVGAAFGFLALAALAAVPRFARDLRRLRELPAPSAAALAASIALLPVVLGEGLAGLGLGLLVLALVNGPAWRKLWVISAGVVLVLALHPVLERRAERHAALLLDPVALAAWSTERGTPNAAELARVVRAADTDPMAARALALRLARQGELAEAERRFTALLEADDSPELLANAAAVRLHQGAVEDAIALYERAADESRSAVVRFNLAQAYGRAIRLDVQDLALLEAQSLDPHVLLDLNHRYNGQDGAFVAYLPLPAGDVLARLQGPEASAALAQQWRRVLAPGVMGESRGDAVVALWLAAAVGLLLGAALRKLTGPEEDLYLGIARLLKGGGDSHERMAQLQELRRRQRRLDRAAGVIAWIVPGAAGLLARRPLLAWLSVALFASAASLWLHRHGAVPDPLALGALPSVLVLAAVALLTLGYLVLLGLCLALREKR